MKHTLSEMLNDHTIDNSVKIEIIEKELETLDKYERLLSEKLKVLKLMNKVDKYDNYDERTAED